MEKNIPTFDVAVFTNFGPLEDIGHVVGGNGLPDVHAYQDIAHFDPLSRGRALGTNACDFQAAPITGLVFTSEPLRINASKLHP